MRIVRGECSHSKPDRTATVVVTHLVDVDLIPCGMADRTSADLAVLGFMRFGFDVTDLRAAPS